MLKIYKEDSRQKPAVFFIPHIAPDSFAYYGNNVTFAPTFISRFNLNN